MILQYFCLSVIVKSLWCSPWYTGAMQDWYNERKFPLFELPCMRLGGMCAVADACPPGMKMEYKGLCPIQQEQGAECCVPQKRASLCCSKKGKCVPKVFECSQHSQVLRSGARTLGENY